MSSTATSSQATRSSTATARVLLGDFGVAGNTVEYAAPELLAGTDKNELTDLWAAAATSYELLCGQAPFGRRPELDEAEIANNVAELRLHATR